MTLRSLHFVAIMFAALTLIPSGAHLFVLPNKINMGPAQYFTVQSIYSGWARWGFVLVGALIANGVLALMVRGEPCGVLRLGLSGKSSDQQLDCGAGELAVAAHTLGVRPCSERRPRLWGILFYDPRGAYAAIEVVIRSQTDA